jgi:hypothetical protein
VLAEDYGYVVSYRDYLGVEVPDDAHGVLQVKISLNPA